MFSIQTKASGLFSFVQKGKGTAQRVVAGNWAAALEVALTEYALGTLQGAKLADRFKPGAKAVYGFASRSAGYEAQQSKANGGATPYLSPRRRTSIGNLGFALARAAAGQASAAEVIAQVKKLTDNIRRNNRHMRDLVTTPGGFRITTKPGRKTVTKITYPGARILNKGGQRSAIYRRQFPDLRMGGGRDMIAILARAKKLYLTGLLADINRGPLMRVA